MTAIDSVGQGLSLWGCAVYCHKVWPNSAHCGQIGYTPNMGTALKDAGAVVVRCKENIGPSKATVSVSLANAGGCPEAWDVRIPA